MCVERVIAFVINNCIYNYFFRTPKRKIQSQSDSDSCTASDSNAKITDKRVKTDPPQEYVSLSGTARYKLRDPAAAL